MWVTLVAALVYCAWLGWHWLPLGYSDKELAASVSRVWDVKRELTEHGRLPWWTPYFMSGSSYALNHSRGFYLVPWLLLSTFTDLQVAGKLMALTAIVASAMTMYFCARHFLRHEWAATLAALAYMLHPEQLIRAAGQEHITISLFFPFIPLLWWTFARMLETQRFRDVFFCALTAVFGMWTDNKQAVIHFFFLAFYLVFWLWPAERRARRQAHQLAGTLGMLAAVGLAMGAAVVVPGLCESKYAKLFVGEPLAEWQKSYAFRSLLGLVDRNGAVVKQTVEGVLGTVQAQGGLRNQQEWDAVRRLTGLQMESPEKYAGLALLAVVAVTALGNQRRINRGLFWLFVALWMLSVMLAMGRSTVWGACMKTWDALSSVKGVPGGTWLTVYLGVAALVGFLVLFARRKLTTARKRWIAGGALAAFLFLPGFSIVASLPYFKEIRAPFVFYDGPSAFWGAILIGFFVTDLLESERWRAHVPGIVAGVAILLLFDYWPYQKPTKDNGVPARTLQNLQAAYAALKQDPDWVKTYSVSGRYFHLLGPMWCGKPQVYEAFYNWMCPLGTGLLNQAAGGSRDMLNLLGARYVVFDKTDRDMQTPQLQQVLASYRQVFPVILENEDFVVFRNDLAHPYVTGYARACLFDGDIRQSPQLALSLSGRNWPLVHGDSRAVATMEYEQVYRGGEPPVAPFRNGELVQLAGVQLVRENSQRVRIRLTAPRDCLAVIAESYYPYWRAEIDGKPVEVLRVSCALMGVKLPAGTHEIVLRYETPRAYAVAGVVSLVALISCGAASFRHRP